MNADWSWADEYDIVGLSDNWSGKNEFLRTHPQRENSMFMWIYRRRKYTDVTVDTVFAPPGETAADSNEDTLIGLTDMYLGKGLQLNKRHAVKKMTGFRGTGFFGIEYLRDDLANEYAQEVANVLFG